MQESKPLSAEKWSTHARAITAFVGLVLLACSAGVFPASAASNESEAVRIYEALTGVDTSATECVYMTGAGESMYPTIRAGDRVKVQFYRNATSIVIGDIIVFHAWMVGAIPEGMWIGHRVIEKSRQGDTWYFKTKGDSCPSPDGWNVPDYAILGTIVNIQPAEPSNESVDTPSQGDQSNLAHPSALLPHGSEATIFCIGALCFGGIITVFHHLKQRRREKLRRAYVYSCYTCKYCVVDWKFQVELTNGRMGLRRVLDVSRGFCRQFDRGITNFPRRDCERYEPQNRNPYGLHCEAERM